MWDDLTDLLFVIASVDRWLWVFEGAWAVLNLNI